MKKLITILFMFSFCLTAQIDEDHFVGGVIVSFVANLETYEVLKDTNLKPWQSKLIALGSGIAFGTLAGHAKEKWDEKQGRIYSKSDFKDTFWGAVTGSLTVRLFLWNSIPKSHIPIEDTWILENKFLNK